MLRAFFIQFFSVAIQLLIFAIFARVVLSWFPRMSTGRFYLFLESATEPVLRLARKVTPRLGMIDISPIIAFLGLDLIRYVVLRIFGAL